MLPPRGTEGKIKRAGSGMWHTAREKTVTRRNAGAVFR